MNQTDHNVFKKISRRYHIVEIWWLDAHRRNGWWKEEEITSWAKDGDSESMVCQVGYLIKKDKKWVTLTMGVGDDVLIDCHRIPRKGIIGIRRIR